MSKKRILVVDDDHAFLDLMTQHLNKRGYEAVSAQDGLEAMQILRRDGQFSVLVTDLMMPGVSGLELLRKAKKVDSQIEVIVITAAGSLEMAISALREGGAFDYLTKPLELFSELSIAVERAVSYQEMQQERKALRKQLAGGSVQLEAMLTSTKDAVFAADKDDMVAPANASASDILGENHANGNIPLEDMPGALLGVIDRWRIFDSRHPACVEVDWPEGKVHQVHLAPIRANGSNPTGWVMVLRDITYKRQLESLIVRNFGSAAVKSRQKLKNALGLLSTFRANSIAVDTDPAEMVHELEELLLSGYRDLEVPFTVEKSGHDFYSTENGISLQDFFRTHGESFNKEIREEFGCNVGWQIDNNLPKAGVDRTTFRRLIIHLLKCVAPRCKSKQEVRLSVREMGDLIWVEGSVRRQEDSRESAFLSAHPVGRGELLDRSEIELAALRMVVDQAHGQVWIHPLGDGGDAVTFCLPAAS